MHKSCTSWDNIMLIHYAHHDYDIMHKIIYVHNVLA